jgi:pentatricopeptide repeat protein
MQSQEVQPAPITFVRVVNACASLAALEDSRHVHQQMIESNFETDVFVGSSLIYMYTKCGSIDDAWRVFNRVPTQDVVSWSVMILGHVKSVGKHKRHWNYFEKCNAKGCSQCMSPLWGY